MPLRNLPPFRADQVGSLLRPQELKNARAQRERGVITDEELKSVEDRYIQDLIAKEESVGLLGITDGEFRRSFWHLDFLEKLCGVEGYDAEQGITFQEGKTKAKGLRLTGKLDFTTHPFVDHFKFLKAHTSRTAKMTIPSPSVLHYRGGRTTVSEQVYPAMDEFYHDLGQAYKKAVAAFGEADCKYLQLDEVNFTYLCDADQRQMLRDRGDDPDKLPDIYADMINVAISGRPSDMRMTMHLCRGNYKSMWIAQGGYEPVAEVLFHKVNIDAYFMEWDSERAGGFEPLRLVPKNKQVVLGLVTTKTGELESKDQLKRRLDEVSQFIDLDQVCISGQCGFASTEEGNLLTEEQQWAKLTLIVETANEVWG